MSGGHLGIGIDLGIVRLGIAEHGPHKLENCMLVSPTGTEKYESLFPRVPDRTDTILR